MTDGAPDDGEPVGLVPDTARAERREQMLFERARAADRRRALGVGLRLPRSLPLPPALDRQGPAADAGGPDAPAAVPAAARTCSATTAAPRADSSTE